MTAFLWTDSNFCSWFVIEVEGKLKNPWIWAPGVTTEKHSSVWGMLFSTILDMV